MKEKEKDQCWSIGDYYKQTTSEELYWDCKIKDLQFKKSQNVVDWILTSIQFSYVYA